MNRSPGEYTIFPVDNQTFHAWAESHKDYPHRLQYSQDTVVVNVMYPPQDRSSNIIIQQILRRVDAVNGAEVNLSIGTGRGHSLVNLLIFSHKVEKQRPKKLGSGDLLT